jgi:hypothetical protein
MISGNEVNFGRDSARAKNDCAWEMMLVIINLTDPSLHFGASLKDATCLCEGMDYLMFICDLRSIKSQ